jgi:hypothetical protein
MAAALLSVALARESKCCADRSTQRFSGSIALHVGPAPASLGSRGYTSAVPERNSGHGQQSRASASRWCLPDLVFSHLFTKGDHRS